MRSPFRKRSKQAASEPEVNRIDALVSKLQQERRLQDLEVELQRLRRKTLSPNEREAWSNFYGVAAFRAGRNDEALRRFEEAYRHFPSSARIRFSLGQQYERARQVEQAFALFDQCRFPDVGSEYALTEARYAYLWDRYEQGRQYLRPIFDSYRKLEVLDDTFLYMRGLPFFSRWWSYLAAFSILSEEWAELEDVTEYVSGHCRDYDFDDLRAQLSAYRTKDIAALAAQLEAKLAGLPKGNFPTGYLRLSLAIARARQSPDREQAKEILASVHFGDQDFRWLKDMRLLAEAEVAARFGDCEAESCLQREFLERQPLLFEPDNALTFHLLEYQESLKPVYRERRYPG